MAENRHLQHVRSKVVSVIDDKEFPKLPSADNIRYGEIAINYHKGTETVSLRNDADEIVTFHDEVEITSGSPKSQTEIWIDLSDPSSTEIYSKQQIDSFLSGISEIDYRQDEAIQDLIAKTDELSGDTISKITEAIEELSGTVDTKVGELEEADDNLAQAISDEVARATQSEQDLLVAIGAEELRAKGAEEAISGLAENAYEVQIGTDAEPTDAIKLIVDTNADASTLIYTKEQVDSQISGFTTDINGIKAKDVEQDGRLAVLESKTDGIDEYTINNIEQSIANEASRAQGAEGDLSDAIAAERRRAEGVEQELAEKIDSMIVIGANGTDDTEVIIDTSGGDGDPYVVYTKAQVDAIIAELQRQIDELKQG